MRLASDTLRFGVGRPLPVDSVVIERTILGFPHVGFAGRRGERVGLRYLVQGERYMTTETPTDSLTQSIRLTDVAAVKVAALLAQEGRDDLMLRVAVQPGGCSGLRYQLYFDERNQDGDVIHEFGTVKVIIDKMSDPYLMGASIDFVDTIEKQGFTIDNPNAGGSCACGDSFN